MSSAKSSADSTPSPSTSSPPLVEKSRFTVSRRMAVLGLLINLGLVTIKLIAGVVGNSYALIADGVESTMDVLGSLVVWAGLRIAHRPADSEFPYGYGRAEPLTVAVVALLLLAAAAGIAWAAIQEILTPQHAPESWTLGVLAAVILAKELLYRKAGKVAEVTQSVLMESDAWHHRSDALTSATAFLGILIALVGGKGYESADDWAALLAAGIIAWNGWGFLTIAITHLMDRQDDPELLEKITTITTGVPGVLNTEKLRVRKAAHQFYVDIHVQANPELSLADAHLLSGRVKSAIREAVSEVRDVLIHMEPYQP